MFLGAQERPRLSSRWIRDGLGIRIVPSLILIVILGSSSVLPVYAALAGPPSNIVPGTGRDSRIILNPSTSIDNPTIVNSTFSVSGRLVDARTGIGIDGEIKFSAANAALGKGYRGLPPASTLGVILNDPLGLNVGTCTAIGCDPDESERGCGIVSPCDGNNYVKLHEGGIISFEKPHPAAVQIYVQNMGPQQQYFVEVTKGNPSNSSSPTFVAQSFGDAPHTTVLEIASNQTISSIRILNVTGGHAGIPGFVKISQIRAHNLLAEPSLMLAEDFERSPAGSYGNAIRLTSGSFYSVGVAEFTPDINQPKYIVATFDGNGMYRGSQAMIALYTEESARQRGSLGVDPSVTEPDEPGGNNPPIADAGEDQTVEAPAEGDPSFPVYLDGRHSFDAEGSALTYQWQFMPGESDMTLGSGPEFDAVSHPSAANSDGSLQMFTLGPSLAGSTLVYSLTVTETDDAGLSSSPDTVEIHISEPTSLGGAGEPTSLTAYAASIYTRIICGAGDDTDGDFICDSWENDSPPQVTYSGAVVPLCLPDYYHAGGADVCPVVGHKDIYLELDYYNYHQLDDTAIQDVVNAFDSAPGASDSSPSAYGDPDGITLHVWRSDAIAEPGSSTPTHYNDLHTWTDTDTNYRNDFASIKSYYFGNHAWSSNQHNAWAQVAHYVESVHSIGSCGPSGAAETRGNDIVISLGCGFAVSGVDPNGSIGSIDQQEGTLMHELGHNLNLLHGGSSTVNCKPNYLSVMTYTRQFNNYLSTRSLDYSHYPPLSNLVETSLPAEASSSLGAPANTRFINAYSTGTSQAWRSDSPGTPNINWNNDLDKTDPAGSSEDVNNFAISGCGASASQTLTGYDDWGRLTYDVSGGSASYDGAFPDPRTTSEITPYTLRQIEERTTSIVVNKTNTITPVAGQDEVMPSGYVTNSNVGDYVLVLWGDGAKTQNVAISPTGEWGPVRHIYDAGSVGQHPVVVAELFNGTSDSVEAITHAFGVYVQPGPPVGLASPQVTVDGAVVGVLPISQQATISTALENSLKSSQPYAAIVEVRDSSGITTFIGWQTGELPPEGQTDIGISWTPEASGEQTVRAFVITDFDKPMLLTAVKEGHVTVTA